MLIKKNAKRMLTVNVDGHTLIAELDDDYFIHFDNPVLISDLGLPKHLRGKGIGKGLLYDMVKKYGYAFSGSNSKHIRSNDAKNMWDSLYKRKIKGALPKNFHMERVIAYSGLYDVLFYLGDDNKESHSEIGLAVNQYLSEITGDGHHSALLSIENDFGVNHVPSPDIREIFVRSELTSEISIDLSSHKNLTFLDIDVATNKISLGSIKCKELQLCFGGSNILPEWVYGIEGLEKLVLEDLHDLKLDYDKLSKIKTLKTVIISNIVDISKTITEYLPFEIKVNIY